MTKSIYSVHPGVAMVHRTILTLKEKTGLSLDEWKALVVREGPADHAKRAAWLKAQHGLGTNYAKWIADLSSGKNAEDGDPDAYLAKAEEYVAAQYAGKKAPMKPVYDALLSLGFSMGSDVRACPGKTNVPLYRKNVFAHITPSTLTRVDLGLALKGKKPPKRLIDTGGEAKGDRITHRIAISNVSEIDDVVEKWMRVAYELGSESSKSGTSE